MAEVRLATNGQDRVTGRASVRAQPGEDGTPGTAFRLELGGDVASLLPPENAPFFGPQSQVLVEGWRGEVCHAVLTDAAGRFRRYKMIDPSFHNWTGLALALRGTAISDFPICNKSFNLSFCGFDL